MEKVKIKYWVDNKDYLGYLIDYPEYITQGSSIEELKENLYDIYKDITAEVIPGLKKTIELEFA